jgi:Na+/melibiose symporter-like transporter
MCSAGWFFYFAGYYLIFVVKMEPRLAGIVSLAGQITDGITTPIVGLFSDKIKTRIGSRAPWYILGTIIVIPAYFFLWISPFGVPPDNVIT